MIVVAVVLIAVVILLCVLAFQVQTDGPKLQYTITIGNSPIALFRPYRGRDSLPDGLIFDDSSTTSAPSEVTLAPGATTPFTLALKITDCAKFPDQPWPLRLRARTSTAPNGYVIFSPPGAGPEAWQRSATRDYCNTGR